MLIGACGGVEVAGADPANRSFKVKTLRRCLEQNPKVKKPTKSQFTINLTRCPRGWAVDVSSRTGPMNLPSHELLIVIADLDLALKTVMSVIQPTEHV